MAAKILVVDDDVELVRGLEQLLSQEGYQVVVAFSAEEALESCRIHTFHLVLTDLQLPSRSGIALIRTLREVCPETATVLITGHGSIRSAVTALKGGAAEYVTKPVRPQRLLQLTRALVDGRPAFLSNRLLAGDRQEVVSFDGLQARSSAMLQVFDRIQVAADSTATVLVLGESGTGKELVARSIHRRSAHAGGPFMPVHTGAIPQELIASELFGHERGAFTGAVEAQPGKFELAENGTLFLDEVSTMDERVQVNLLRVLETLRYVRVGGTAERVANVRVIAASNRDLQAMVQAGELREDLFYRLNIVTIRLPPLRERREDIPVLASELVREFSSKYEKSVVAIPQETQQLLMDYSWPGNVRELRNLIEQAVLLARGEELDPLLLPQMLHRGGARNDVIKIQIGTAMDAIEREVILRTLEANDGNKTHTAEVLGISRRSIYNKLAIYGVGDSSPHSPEPEVPIAPSRAASGG
jgi:DNA-binding NtrC family response regulator